MVTLRSVEVCALTGATFRQIDYWTRQGLLRPVAPGRGSGSIRLYDAEELPFVHSLVALSSLLDRNRSGRRELVEKMRAGEPFTVSNGPVTVSVSVHVSDVEEVAR